MPLTLLLAEAIANVSSSISVACGFLGGTILSVEGGYRVLQHPKPERVFNRIADARWFLAVNWCDCQTIPAAILTHDGQFSFQNQALFEMGDIALIPLDQRQAVFHAAQSLDSGEFTVYTLQPSDTLRCEQLHVLSFEIDPRYGKVAIVRAAHSH